MHGSASRRVNKSKAVWCRGLILIRSKFLENVFEALLTASVQKVRLFLRSRRRLLLRCSLSSFSFRARLNGTEMYTFAVGYHNESAGPSEECSDECSGKTNSRTRKSIVPRRYDCQEKMKIKFCGRTW